MRGRKARRRRVAGGSFTNLGHRESERGGAGVREGAHRQEASSGRRQKRWEKSPCCMRDSQRRRPLLKGIPESTHFSFLPSCFSARGGRMSKPNWSRSRLPLSQERRLSPRSRGRPPWRRSFHEDGRKSANRSEIGVSTAGGLNRTATIQKELILPYFELKEAKRILLASAKLQLSTKSR